MADVTGNLGSEQIRLRGMALEETQYQILQALNKMAGTAQTTPSTAGLNKLDATADVLAGRMSEGSSISKKFSAALTKAKDVLKEDFLLIGRTIRGYDSNIRDSSYAMRQMAQLGGKMGAVSKFAAESVSQLEEQYDVYKRLSGIGGVVAVDFENMRVKASELGTTMQEYMGVMESNFVNLRLGGQGARNSMNRLTKEVMNLREGSEEINNSFMRLGIQSQDYGQHIMEITNVMGGFNRIVGTGGQKFQERILSTTMNLTSLADAFGYNRDQILKQSSKAMNDPIYRTLLKDITTPGKDLFVNAMHGIFGDEATAMELAIGSYTPVMTKTFGKYAAFFGDDFIGKMKKFSAIMEETNDRELALRESGMNDWVSSVQSQRQQIAAIGLQDNDMGAVSRAKLNLVDMLMSTNTDFNNLKKSIAGPAGQIDTLGKLQREHIAMAITFAKTNKSLNNFGLTTAFAMQLIAKAMSKLAKGTITSMDKIFDDMGGFAFMDKMTREGQQAIDSFGENMGEAVDKVLGVKTETGKVQPVGGVPAPTDLLIINDKVINVQGKKVLASQVDTANTEATSGGPTNSYLKQVLAAIANLNPNFKLNAAIDSYGPEKPHKVPHLNKLDIGKPEGVSSEDFTKQIVSMLSQYVDPSHFKVVDEYKNPSKNASGGHVHIEMSPEAQAAFYKNYFTKNAPSGTPLPKSVTVPVPPRSSNNAENTEVQQKSSSSSSSTNQPVSTAINTSTDKSVVAEPTWWGDLKGWMESQNKDRVVLNSNMVAIKQSVDELGRTMTTYVNTHGGKA